MLAAHTPGFHDAPAETQFMSSKALPIFVNLTLSALTLIHAICYSDFLNVLYLFGVILKITDSERGHVIMSMKLPLLIKCIYKQDVKLDSRCRRVVLDFVDLHVYMAQ